MKKITKLCGTKKSYIIIHDETSNSNQIYICNKCKRETKEKILLCYPEIKEEKDSIS